MPPGFIITTQAYQEFLKIHHLDAQIETALAGLDANASSYPAALEAASAQLREAFRTAYTNHGLPGESATEIIQAYRLLGSPPVAVRSSATAEDLPEASFAGQQDTFLNIQSEGALIDAVVNCWSSLWTARAIGYRSRNHIPHLQTALAVVIQQMVPALAAGVLFTANPLTGLREEIVIDAILGLGEALVAGQVEPDHYLVQRVSTSSIPIILEKHLGAKALQVLPKEGGGVQQVAVSWQQATPPALPDEVILALAEMGWRIAQEYGEPQDIEWAWDGEKLHLLQSRPITSLYPLPANLPADPIVPLVSFGALQGVLDPITPFGQDGIASFMAAGARTLLGIPLTLENQRLLLTAGERLFINISAIARSRLGRRILPGVFSMVEPGSTSTLDELLNDPRLAPGHFPISPKNLLPILRLALPVVVRIPGSLLRPEKARRQTFAQIEQVYTQLSEQARRLTEGATLAETLVFFEHVLQTAPPVLARYAIPRFGPALGLLAALSKTARKLVTTPNGGDIALEITRGLLHNVTTEMALALWETAQVIRSNPAAAQIFTSQPAFALAQAYQAGELPATAQVALDRFLARYGVRGVGEIDIGQPRWGENPTPVMEALLSYLQIEDPQLAPPAVFARGAQAAEAAITELVNLARRAPAGRLNAWRIRWMASRVRHLAGLRELPKFFAVRLMGLTRRQFLTTGAQLVAAGLLEQPQDIFYLRVAELRQIAAWQTPSGGWYLENIQTSLQPADLKPLVNLRRQRQDREKLRRQVPRLLLSDGRAFYGSTMSKGGQDQPGSIHGSPVSPGVVEGYVRVVFNPHQAGLQPGEILVCPGTDPAWTPLFLAAGGLVMEVGGMVTHGSVVAREYGIPAVVGVPAATQRLQTGMRIRVDGSAGVITVLESIE